VFMYAVLIVTLGAKSIFRYELIKRISFPQSCASSPKESSWALSS
jgi:hypothetical protein